MLAIAGHDGKVRVVDLVSSQVAGVLKHEGAVQCCFDHKGEYLLSGASDEQMCVVMMDKINH